MFTATLIAAEALGDGDISAAMDRLAAAGCAPGASGWIEERRAADLFFALGPDAAREALEGSLLLTDVVVQPAEGRRKAVLVADMDSTMITVECIDELADYAGIKAEIAAITERAMRGELDFEAALTVRVALLKGLRVAAVERCLAERVRIMPGARELVQTMRANGALTVLVSGGFTCFAEPVAATIGFERAIANVLEVDGGALAGTVAKPIVGADAKLAALQAAVASRCVGASDSLAVGDGANDMDMIRSAGLGVAYHAKPIVAAAAAARIDHNDLTALLYAQGYPRGEWAAV